MGRTNLNPVGWLAFWLFCLLAAPVFAQSPTDARLLTAEGKVEVALAGTSEWHVGATNQALQVGDRLRTGLRSRATVRLSNLTVLRVNELTTLQIQPPSQPGQSAGLDLKSGTTYFLSRERGNETEFRTPLASGAIRGTEFNLKVAADGRSEVTLIDGDVLLANNLGQAALVSGEQGVVEPGQAPRKSPFIEAVNIIQWSLYYPGVVNVEELAFSPPEQPALAASLAAYRSGDLLAAREQFPQGVLLSDAGLVYKAALDVSVGQLDAAQSLTASPQADALRELIAAVKHQTWTRTAAPTTASGWMAESYYLQSQSKLEAALEAARNAVRLAPDFGFAWAREAELEFSFGHTEAALAALDHGLQLSPRNAQAVALQGFLLAARNRIPEAQAQFEQAISLDGALGNAWLGRGLCRIRRGDAEGGRADLQVAAALEPSRAVLRSYLGKAFSNAGDSKRAAAELALAKRFDPNDPTAWLYSALLHQQDNEVNDAVRDLEQSQALNDNRQVYRSRLLLDQDKAVRSANLAGIYRDEGMTDLSVREASRAVDSDYANYSAHQFLANSYDALRDPNNINLRYETPWLDELLVANLLSPVGAGNLSTHVSQQEYSRLFDADHVGGSTLTEYQSSGAWREEASQYGVFGNSSYSVDLDYRTDPGQRDNNDIEQFTWWLKFKQQLSASDSVFLQLQGYEANSGDVGQYYDQASASAGLRVKENQRPNLAIGYHHEWSPGSHTLFLFSRLDDTLDLSDPAARVPFIAVNAAGGVRFVRADALSILTHREFTAYSGELQHIWQTEVNTLVVGGRYQSGDLNVYNQVNNPNNGASLITAQDVKVDLERETVYAYDTWQVLDSLSLIGGLSYDRLKYPRNVDTSPVTSAASTTDRVSPKAGLLWKLGPNTHLRAAYTRSLGGVSYETSTRLEPAEIAGFTQAYRSIAPESAVGISPGARFETAGLGLEHRFPTETYLTVEGQLLRSDGSRTVGATTNSTFIPTADAASSTEQSLKFEEKTLLVTLNQLVGKEWSFGARYRLSYADLQGQFVNIPTGTLGVAGLNQDQQALLNQINLYAIYTHPSGFFARAEAIWSEQSNMGYSPDEPGAEFWQFNVFAGWRFWQRRAEAQVGILNLADRDYRLNPLNLYDELPRERTFVARCKIYF